MKTFRYLTIAVLGLVMAACSSDIASEQPVESHQGKGIPFTATISMRGSATRSAMTESTSTISAAWETGDSLALVYEVSGQKQVTKATMTVSDDKSATITATIAEGVTTGTTVKLLYPYSKVCNDPAEAATYGTIRKDALAGQDGTLETIAKDYDLCQGDGEFTLMSDGTASLKADVTMASQIAIWKLSLSDGANALKTKQLFIIKDNDTENMLVNALLQDEASVFYVAVPAISNANIDIQTPVGVNTYFYSKKGVTLEAGKFYQSAVTMADMLHTPLTLEAIADGTITFKNNAKGIVKYRVNNGNQQEIAAGQDGSIDVKANDIVQFFGDNATYAQDNTTTSKISCTSNCYIYGNIMSLINSTDFATATELTGDHTFQKLFYENKYIKNHILKDLLLPATTLKDHCYYGMFNLCTGLTAVPALPATTLASFCYSWMFTLCSGLTTLPEDLLPATTLAEECYSYMFTGCTVLTNAPKLPATTLAEKCYSSMFNGCYNLSSVTCLATDIRAQDCLNLWLSDAGKGEGCERLVYVDASMTDADWQLGTSGEDGKRWSAAAIGGGITPVQ
jgi:hypothetical protein